MNRLWKKLDRLEREKRSLQVKLNENSSTPNAPNAAGAAPVETKRPVDKSDSSEKVASHVKSLKKEVDQLRNQLTQSSEQHTTQMKSMENEEKSLREENFRLQRKLNMEVERREALHRHLSESDVSVEMDDDRFFCHRS